MEYVIKKGTKTNLEKYLSFYVDYIKDEYYPNLTDSHFRQLFCEALGRNIVVAELVDMLNILLKKSNDKLS